MAVVIMIGLVALIAVPTAARAMRERRSSQAAHEVSQLFNQARSRAIARGSAVLVRYNYSNGGFEVREGVAGPSGVGNCELAPASSCTVPSSRWDDGSGYFRTLSKFQPLGTSTYEMVDIQFQEFSYDNETEAVTTDTPTEVDLCMAPSGRSFFRKSTSGTFAPMTGNHAIKVWMHSGGKVIGIERLVYILPSGMARVGT